MLPFAEDEKEISCLIYRPDERLAPRRYLLDVQDA